MKPKEKYQRIREILGEDLYRTFWKARRVGRREPTVYFYLLHVDGRLSSLFSSNNWELFKFDEEAKRLFKFKKDYGGMFFGGVYGYPEFHELDRVEVDEIIEMEKR